MSYANFFAISSSLEAGLPRTLGGIVAGMGIGASLAFGPRSPMTVPTDVFQGGLYGLAAGYGGANLLLTMFPILKGVELFMIEEHKSSVAALVLATSVSTFVFLDCLKSYTTPNGEGITIFRR